MMAQDGRALVPDNLAARLDSERKQRHAIALDIRQSVLQHNTSVCALWSEQMLREPAQLNYAFHSINWFCQLQSIYSVNSIRLLK